MPTGSGSSPGDLHAARADTVDVLRSEAAAVTRSVPTVLEVPIAATVPPHTSAGTLRQLVLEGKIHSDVRPGPGGAVEADRAAQGLDAVGKAR